MAADKTIKALFDEIQGAVDKFQGRLPAVQHGSFESMLEQLKALQTQGGKVLNSVQNLKLIGELRNKLERLILTEGYKDSVREFISAFDAVEGLHIQYFADFGLKFKAKETLNIVRKLAVDQTANQLAGQGLGANIIDPVSEVLRSSITTGGSYASLVEQMRQHLTKTDTPGSLEQYARTITTDAVNQYSANYHEMLARDLELNWGRYIGSNIATTREFCELLTTKEWVHRSELPEIVAGHINGHSCKLSTSTGLPLGMIPGTDANNFKVRRGGYNCGHQLFYVPDSVVPAQVKARLVEFA